MLVRWLSVSGLPRWTRLFCRSVVRSSPSGYPIQTTALGCEERSQTGLLAGEIIVTGEAAKLPMRCRVTLPAKEHRPSSGDPEVSKKWRLPRRKEGYRRVVASWRSQSPIRVTEDLEIERVSVEDKPAGE